ncbi:MFS transporter [Massilia sp. TWR1-2-2]|uniref:MFS transporter n=1 Tax=Massilia sp. TWR1-2-2 TaxID=2804584 RepID=UPI003CED3F14
MAVYLTVLLSVLNQIGLKGSKMLVALYAIELHASPLTIGLLISMYAIFPLLLAVYAGRYSDRVGMRRPMVFGSFALCGGMLVPTMFPGMAALFVSAAVIGTANIFFHVASHNLIGALGSQAERTANFGTFSLGSALSGMGGPMLVGFMVDRGGYTASYYVLAAVTIWPGLFMLFWHRFIPPPRAHAQARAHGSALELLQIPRLRNTLLTSGVILTGMDLFNFYMPIHGRAIGLSASAIGVIIGMQAAAAFVVRMWMPAMSRKYGEMRVLTWSLLVSGATFLLLPAFRDPVVLAAVAFLLGLGLGCGQPLSTILTYNHSPPGRSGEALGMRLTVNKFTQIMVPLVFGSLGSAFGIVPIFATTALLLLGGGINNARHEKDIDPAP